MGYKIPTYEEYKSATKFARFRYRFSILIMFLSWICLIFIIFYMVSNGEAISRNPLIYGADKYDVVCHCYSEEGRSGFYVNGSSIWNINYLDEINLSNIKLPNGTRRSS